MPNRTFFLDNETRHSSRSRSLPTRSRPESVTTPSRQVQSTQGQRSSERDASHYRYARRLAKTERARSDRRRLFYRSHPTVNQQRDFEQTFQSPPSPEIAANLNNAAADLAWCSNQYPPRDITSLTPMERFLVVDPGEEQWCVESRARPQAIGVREGHVSSANDRVHIAVELAAAARMVRRQAALQGPMDGDEVRNPGGDTGGHGRSWLNLEDDSQASRSGGSRRAERKGKSKTRRAKFSQSS